MAADLVADAAGWREDVEPSIEDRVVASWQAGNGLRSGVYGLRSLTEAGSASALLTQAQPQFSPFQRRTYLRDLVPAFPTKAPTVGWVRELHPVADEGGGASGVAEGTDKPDVSAGYTFQPLPVTAGTLADTIPLSRQLLDDAPTFRAYLTQQRLPYRMRVAEERACLLGGGEAVNAGITGIVNDSDVAALALPPAGDLIGTLLAMAGAVAGRGAETDAAFVNAVDWFTALESATVDRLAALDKAGFEVLPTIALPRGTAVAGAFAGGCTIIDREDVSVEVYREHSDYAKKNLSLVVCEERVGFVCTWPWAFSYVEGWS